MHFQISCRKFFGFMVSSGFSGRNRVRSAISPAARFGVESIIEAISENHTAELGFSKSITARQETTNDCRQTAGRLVGIRRSIAESANGQ